MIIIKITVDNLEINYIKQGTGRNVLILPGWGTTVETYKTLIDCISTYRTVYCLDMPGCGLSEEPKNVWNLDKYVEFILKFIQELNIQELDLIGHSNGGRIIIKMMSNPNVNIKVNSIILIGSAGIVHPKPFRKRVKIRTYKICKKIIQIKPIKSIFPNALTKLQTKFGSEDYKNASPIMRQNLVNLVNEDLREIMPNVKIPTLLIWGENDTETPIADAEIMEKLIPDCGLVRIKNCSHYVFLEQSVYVNNIINNFLTRGDNK